MKLKITLKHTWEYDLDATDNLSKSVKYALTHNDDDKPIEPAPDKSAMLEIAEEILREDMDVLADLTDIDPDMDMNVEITE